MTHRTPVAAGLFVLCLALSAPAADTVILKDGFVIQGNVRKELDSVRDPNTGRVFTVTKADGLDMIDEGPKIVIFSTHAKQLGEINKDVKLRPEYKHYTNFFSGRKSENPFQGGAVKNMTPFDAKWRRTITYTLPGNLFDKVEQQITFIDPYTTYLVSPTHVWRQAFRTAEMDPFEVRKLLATHPELAEPDGKLDPAKRVAITRFVKDAGWLFLAQQEIETITKEFKGEMAKDVKDAFEALKKEVDQATAELPVNEAELALKAGRYKFAAEALAAFPEKTADPKDIDRATRHLAQLKTAKERYETGRRLLRSVIDEATGLGAAGPLMAVGGGPSVVALPSKGSTPLAMLAAAAEVVYGELHSDSAERIEFFVNLAAQAEREKAAGKEPTKKPDELLATAVSGWVKGKNGATPQPAAALRLWAAREMVLGYQGSTDLNARNAFLFRYKKGSPLPIDELAQVVSLLPPAEPEDMTARTGTLVPAMNGVGPETYRRTTRAGGDGKTVDYLIKLPPEYHHGRAYPVMIAVSHPGNDPEQMMAVLTRECDRYGFILAVPAWGKGFNQATYDFSGADHPAVTHVLRDIVRHFTVDNDRVYLCGAGDGATLVMDVGVSHPDLFAGVVAMAPPYPKWANVFQAYWTNAQKLPFYVVTGEGARDSFKECRSLFERFTRNGFPSLLTIYKGRGIEWYTAEVPGAFDWLSRKKRATAASTLRPDLGTNQLAWHSMREGDNHFFWIGVNRVSPAHLLANVKPGVPVVPAKVTADIRGVNNVSLKTIGVREVTVWLSRDMIDWTKPVNVNLNSNTPPGWRAKKLEPDLDVLLEDYRERGDRRMLFMGKLEFQTGN